MIKTLSVMCAGLNFYRSERLKKTILICCLVLFAAPAFAVKLLWEPSTGSVKGYVVYFSDGTDNYTYHAGQAIEVDNIEDTLNLVPGVAYTFTVRAYNDYMFSEDSNSVGYTKPGVVVPENTLPGDVDVPTTTIITIQ